MKIGAKNYPRCATCGELMRVETTGWPAPGVHVQYRRCKNGHRPIRMEARITPTRPRKKARKRKKVPVT